MPEISEEKEEMVEREYTLDDGRKVTIRTPANLSSVSTEFVKKYLAE